MKRSEMLNLIWESINEVEDADVLLTKMEKAGIIPPWGLVSRNQWVEVDGIGYYTGDIYAHQWEKEDE